MLMMVTLICVGIVLRKKDAVPKDADVTLSKLLTYVLVPALNMGNMIKNCTVENFKNNYVLILYGGAFVLLTIIIGSPLSKLFVRKTNDVKQKNLRDIYKYALIFSNTGYIGTYVILGIWGDMMLYKYQMFLLVFSIVCSSYGLYLLIPKDEGVSVKESIKKAIMAPPIVGLVIGMVCGLAGLSEYIPDFLTGAVDSAANCMGPIAMILAGIVIGESNILKLLSNVKVYCLTALRLLIIPALICAVLILFKADADLLTVALIAYASPIGMNTIVYTAAYGGETKTGAAMTVVSSFLSVVTIPVMYWLLTLVIK